MHNNMNIKASSTLASTEPK